MTLLKILGFAFVVTQFNKAKLTFFIARHDEFVMKSQEKVGRGYINRFVSRVKFESVCEILK